MYWAETADDNADQNLAKSPGLGVGHLHSVLLSELAFGAPSNVPTLDSWDPS